MVPKKKKEAQIIAKIKSKKESLEYLSSEFRKIDNPNNKIIFDIANYYKNSKDYETAIKYYSKLIKSLKKIYKLDLIYFTEEVEVTREKGTMKTLIKIC